MTTRVKKEELKKVYVVVDSFGTQSGNDSFDAALRHARALHDAGSSDISIFEVTRAWSVELPEEPLPEAVEMELSSI